MSWNNSSTQLNAIFQAIWLPQNRVKDCYNGVLLVAGSSPFDLLLLDELLIEAKLYDDSKISMSEYVESKLSPELLEHFNILFLHHG